MYKDDALELINDYLEDELLNNKNTHYATVSSYHNKRGWWINIPFNKFKNDLYIILQSNQAKQVIVLKINADQIMKPQQIFRNKDNKADIFIEVYNENDLTSSIPLNDSQSKSKGMNFSSFILETLNFNGNDYSSNDFPDEIVTRLNEGKQKKIYVNAYERNSGARTKCISHYGTQCIICRFDFERNFGERGKGFIHVHHIVALSAIKTEYKVDPISDLRPVCPNCHAMLHRKGNISIEELIIERNNSLKKE